MLVILLLLKTSLASIERIGEVEALCRGGAHVEGSWVRWANGTDRRKSFICDPLADRGRRRLDYPYQYHSGLNNREWSDGCACDHKHGNFTIHEREHFDWVPKHCSLLKWNATLFCDLLGSRLLMLTGDSTMHQTASTLMFLLEVGGGSCGSQVFFGLSHWLIFKGGAHIRWDHWLTDSYDHQPILPNIVIMTAGAHLEDLGDMLTVWNSDAGLDKDIPKYKELYNITFAWKTQNPGHLRCMQFNAPISEPMVISANDPDNKFHWDMFPAFDNFSKEQATKLTMPIIDMAPLYLRPDAHTSDNRMMLHHAVSYDCLHFCLPGPLDIFSQILLTMLYNGEI